MKNSIIINTFYRLFVAMAEYYKHSYTNRAVNKVSSILKRYFSYSLVYKVLTKNTTGKCTEHSSIIRVLEKLLQNIVILSNNLFIKGMNGSLFFRLIRDLEQAVKSSSVSFITYIIMGFTIVYNGIYILKGIINLQVLMISFVVVSLSILLNYYDVRIGIRNSFIIKGFAKIFGTGFEE